MPEQACGKPSPGSSLPSLSSPAELPEDVAQGQDLQPGDSAVTKPPQGQGSPPAANPSLLVMPEIPMDFEGAHSIHEEHEDEDGYGLFSLRSFSPPASQTTSAACISPARTANAQSQVLLSVWHGLAFVVCCCMCQTACMMTWCSKACLAGFYTREGCSAACCS